MRTPDVAIDGRTAATQPGGIATRLKISQHRLALLARRSVMLTGSQSPLPERLRPAVERFATEAGTLQRDLAELAASASPWQRAAIEPMIVHARRLEEFYAEASNASAGAR
jgi:hypothetical protein